MICYKDLIIFDKSYRNSLGIKGVYCKHLVSAVYQQLKELIDNYMPIWVLDVGNYNKVIEDIQFTNGYISSDSLDHPICNELIQKYNLKPLLTEDCIDIIMFGSTCKNIILSNGTFSWMIGALGYHSTIYYPDPKLKQSWHGDIFVFEDWNKVQYE